MSDHVPQNLWYNFERLNLDILKDSKRGYEMDLNPSHNQIFVIGTKYDGQYTIGGVGNTTFSFNLPQIPDPVLSMKTTHLLFMRLLQRMNRVESPN